MSQDTISDFYWISNPLGRAYTYAGPQGITLDEMREFARGVSAPDTAPILRWGGGRKQPSDIVWFGVVNLVVSARFLDVLSDFTGWATYPVGIYDGFGNLCAGYAGLAIVGRCGRMQYDTTRTEIQETWGWTNYVGLQFDIDTWDGSDIFYPTMGAGPVVTTRLRNAIRKAKITNCDLKQLSEVRTEQSMVDRWIERKVGPYSPDDPLIP